MYVLIGLVGTYGPGPVDDACATALQFDVIAVPKIASMLQRATEKNTPDLPVAAGSTPSRFSRDPAEYTTSRPQLALIPDPDDDVQE